MFARQFQKFAYSAIRRDRDRITDDAAFEFFDRADLARLLLDRHVLVHDPDPAFLCHRNGQARFGHRVHGGRHQWNVQRDRSGQAGLQVDFGGQHVGQGRQQQNVVEGECVVCYPQHGRGLLCEIKRATVLADQ